MSILLKNKSFLLLLFLSTTLLWQNASIPGFFHDGYLYSAFAKNAADKGYWLVPHLSSATYSEFYQHTPFVFILQGIFFKIFGSSYLAARMFVGMFFLILLYVHYNFLKKEEGEWTAFLNSLFLILLPPLMKKLRFPNMDIPLMLSIYLSIICYYLYLIKNKTKYWIGCGLFFGCSVLIKGPIGFFIPIIILLHLFFTKRLNILKSIIPWVSLLFGLLLFALWPLSLFLNGKFYVFESYLQSTFIHTAYDGRDVGNYSVLTYVFFLIKSAPLWTILFFYSFKDIVRDFKRDSFYKLSVISSLVFLILFSLMKFKYSHYLIPFYPFFVFVGLYSVKDWLKKWQDQIFKTVLVLTILLTSFFAIRPLNKITRDPEIYELLQASKQLKSFPTAIANVNAVYPFFALANLMAYEKGIAVYNTNADIFSAQLQGMALEGIVKIDEPNNVNDKIWGYLINKETYLALERTMPQMNQHFFILSYHPTKNLYFVVDKNLVKENSFITF
jgi:4-amino-4-deoxy-L-arabinose transferase-like glycosyltransferase